MQKKMNTNKLSRLRQQLRGLMTNLEQTIKVIFGNDPIIKGTVYQIARKCGKSSCVCTRGELHRNMVLSWSHNGKTKLKSIPKAKLLEIRKKSKEYQCFRKARTQIVMITKRMFTTIDQIEHYRSEKHEIL
jgi:hypothetical protein